MGFNASNSSENLQSTMIPTIVITTPLLDADHEEIPSVTVTRNVDDQDYNPTDITMDSVIVNNAHGSGLYPPSLFMLLGPATQERRKTWKISSSPAWTPSFHPQAV